MKDDLTPEAVRGLLDRRRISYRIFLDALSENAENRANARRKSVALLGAGA